MNVASILTKLHPKEPKAILERLDKYNIVIVTNKTIEMLELQFEQMEMLQPFELDFSIGNIASSYLTQMNAIVANVEAPSEKEFLRDMIYDISTYLIQKVIEFSNREVHETVNIIKNSLKTACQINNYDFDLLNHFLRLDLMYEISAITKRKLQPQIITYYEWLGDPHQLDEIARNLKAENAIDAVKSFKLLFEKHDVDLKVPIASKALPFIMVLFDTLKQNNLILPKGKKGHFTPLVQFSTNLKGGELFIKEPKHIMYSLKGNKKKYEQYVRKAQRWMEQIA